MRQRRPSRAARSNSRPNSPARRPSSSPRPTSRGPIDGRERTDFATRTGAPRALRGPIETEARTGFSIQGARGPGAESGRSKGRTRGAPVRTRTTRTTDTESRGGSRGGRFRPEVPRGGSRPTGGGHEDDRDEPPIPREGTREARREGLPGKGGPRQAAR